MISVIYLSVCVAMMASASVLGVPELPILVYTSALLVAGLGVPHGGLDHWTGRRLLEHRFRGHWWVVFFPAYLATGFVVAVSWIAFPALTVVLFFVLSAWHFGREDQHYSTKVLDGTTSFSLMTQVSAVALGGLVIWVPALVRPGELQTLLTLILPSSGASEAGQVVWLTEAVARVMCPIAGLVVLFQLVLNGRDLKAWVPFATVVISASMPILVSFTAYFCFWHSIIGLQRLRNEEGLTGRQFVVATMPLSAVAVAGVVGLSWLYRNSLAGAKIDLVPASLQTLFIGLSAIAVPHLLLHQWADAVRGKIRRATMPC